MRMKNRQFVYDTDEESDQPPVEFARNFHSTEDGLVIRRRESEISSFDVQCVKYCGNVILYLLPVSFGVNSLILARVGNGGILIELKNEAINHSRLDS